ncbi:MAG: hypothetical protein JO000_16340 [Alphaproteobacteria bacterium]|nr:hypothetical protein [Alphaproteobacteria bacterium]
MIEAASIPEVANKINQTAQIVRPGGPDEFAAEIAEQTRRVAASAEAAGFKRLLQN